MKQIPLTENLRSRLKAALGPDAAVENLAVFETTAVNLLPLRKTSGIYRGARFAQSMFSEMVGSLQNETVPLHWMHNTFDKPVGRVFAGKALDDELRVQFALDATTQADAVSELNSGMQEQVSVGVLPKRLLCSECGWDYMGDAATLDNWWDETCGNGHKIGEEGTHVTLAGLAAWTEMSVVGKGAVRGAKIVGPSQSVFDANPGTQRLAAAEKVPGSKLFCSAVLEFTPKQEPEMTEKVTFDVNKMVTDLVAAQAGETTAKAALTAAETRATALEAKITDLETQLAAKSAVKPEDLTAATDALVDIARRSAIALGEKDPTVPDVKAEGGVAALVAYLTDKQAKLTAAIPAGGRSEGADKTLTAAPGPTQNYSAFFTR